MKRCRRCDSSRLETLRDSVVRRGRRRYLLLWYRCLDCEDVSFAYQVALESGDDHVVIAEVTEEKARPEPEALPSS
jgi:hypothetical protein